MKTQKELRAEYREELRKVWDSQKMIDYCAKDAAFIIEHDGKLYEIDRPSIKKDFYFGYGYNGISTQEEIRDAYDAADYAMDNERYFVDENLRGIDEAIGKLEEVLADMRRTWCAWSGPRSLVKVGKHYCSQTPDCRLNYFSIVDTWRETPEETADAELVEKLIEAYKAVKDDFKKRLAAYLRRYGTTKVRTSVYLCD